MTQVNVDEKLIERVRKLGKHRILDSAVRAALREYVQKRERPGILDLVGKIDFDPGYDYKAARKSKRCS